MKKLFAIFVSLLLTLALAGCGAKEAVQDAVRDALSEPASASGTGDNAGTSEVTPQSASESGTAPAGGAAMESLIDWMRGGTFSYDFVLTSEYEGQVSESTGSAAMDGGNLAITTETVLDGASTKARVIILDGTTYIIDDASRLVMEMTNAGPEMTAGLATDYADMVLVGSGEGEVNGRTLPYEEYTVEDISTKYYMDSGAVYAIESTYKDAYSLMIITNAKNTVSAGAFDIPEDYTRMAI